jgi:hypothetical protein
MLLEISNTADSANNMVMKISPSGNFTTISGNRVAGYFGRLRTGNYNRSSTA